MRLKTNALADKRARPVLGRQADRCKATSIPTPDDMQWSYVPNAATQDATGLNRCMGHGEAEMG